MGASIDKDDIANENGPDGQPSTPGEMRRRSRSGAFSVTPEFRSLLRYSLRGATFRSNRQLGIGSYAIVKEITFREKKYAAKQMHAILFENATRQQKIDMLARFAKECKLLQSVKHPNIVEFVGVHLDMTSQLPLLVMELLVVTWSSYLDTHGIPDTATYHNVLCDVANGLHFLHQHSPPIIHRDLSANNVLLSSTRQAKISDLGVAKVLNPSLHQMTTAPGTPVYMPPEALAGDTQYTISIDVFSFGVLMLHTLCGTWPFPSPATIVDPKNPESVIGISELQRRKQFIEMIDSSHLLNKPIQQCLQNYPASRPNIADLLDILITHNQEAFSFVAKHDYSDEREGNLSFLMGDQLYIISMSGDFCLARSLRTGTVGLIPSNYAAKWNDLESNAWYFGDIKQEEAEKRLFQSCNRSGAYLVRCNDGRFTLSVRNYKLVKHYRIFCPDSKAFFLTQRIQFPSLEALIAHYSLNTEGLCTVLLQPCRDEIHESEIDRRQIQLIRRLGAGQFTVVWEALLNKTASVAVKMLQKDDASASRIFLQEAELMKKLHHPKLIQLFAVSTMEQPIYIVMELMKHRSLLHYLQQGEGQKLLLPDIINMSMQVASGMAYLEKNHYIHRNLTARSVLVGAHNICKIGGLQMAQFVGDKKDQVYIAQKGEKIAIKWTAPEATLNHHFSVKSDVWAFGILLTEFLTQGRPPYPGMTNAEVMARVEHGYLMPRLPNCPIGLYSIMLCCWEGNPAQRKSFGDLYTRLDDYFTDDEDYQDILNI